MMLIQVPPDRKYSYRMMSRLNSSEIQRKVIFAQLLYAAFLLLLLAKKKKKATPFDLHFRRLLGLFPA
jgi:hypothetical protein